MSYEFLNLNDMVFDIGANIGEKTQEFLQLGVKKVIAVEPNKNCFEFLKQKFYGDSRVVLINNAVGAIPGTALLKTISRDPYFGAASISNKFQERMRNTFFMPDGWDTEQEISVITLEHLRKIFGDPDFIKLDIEGSEKDAIYGLEYSVKALSFEFHPQLIEDVGLIAEKLNTLGNYIFAYSVYEESNRSSWFQYDWIQKEIENLSDDLKLYGDVYARLV